MRIHKHKQTHIHAQDAEHIRLVPRPFWSLKMKTYLVRFASFKDAGMQGPGGHGGQVMIEIQSSPLALLDPFRAPF